MSCDDVEKMGPDGLGVYFACSGCDTKIAMVTNAGETQLVSSLGVQLGEARAPATPHSITPHPIIRERLQHEPPAPAAEAGQPVAAKCPFAAALADMGMTSSPQADAQTEVATPSEVRGMPWTMEAEERLARVPNFLRTRLQSEAEAMVRSGGGAVVTAKALDALKTQLEQSFGAP